MGIDISKEAPLLFIDGIAGTAGFVITLAWWKLSGRTLDRDSTLLIAKVFGGIMLFAMFLAFVP